MERFIKSHESQSPLIGAVFLTNMQQAKYIGEKVRESQSPLIGAVFLTKPTLRWGKTRTTRKSLNPL
ncbi:hypothetical protein MTBBW1_1360004 [Desulfamplus magnetovallimortis]|uniref:Uncharacterized protein n=1 Tax=Desulfamplus magnetovallimortis TaxID=1246637 RepID=A0A1W1H7K1_9BACT|nr:hypothetical protein MTBBW1_1360004 [Desulfamplus magnetovallimortis]